MTEPRTSREALIAHMLGELDDLLIRVEQLPVTITEAETRLAITARVLNEAGEKYRLAVTTFTEEAKSALADHIEHQMARALSLAVKEQHVLIEEITKSGHHAAASQCAAEAMSSPPQPPGQLHYLAPKRLVDHLIIAALTSIFTVALFVFVVERS